MAEVPGTSSETITETVQTSTPPPPQQEGRSLTIKLRKRKTEKKVEWSSDTVDNEHLGRRSSKCEFKYLLGTRENVIIIALINGLKLHSIYLYKANLQPTSSQGTLQKICLIRSYRKIQS
uniref:E3 ubiquitin-protein ligase PPP1R11 n=1 Tax=Fundulus heteroclitus TaxID=8078 RepID=A0A3Q2QNZ0_FUNHE